MNHKSAIVWLLVATVGCWLAIIVVGAMSSIIAGFMGMDVSSSKGAFKESLSMLLAAVTALWAATFIQQSKP